jgi:hypothetical protein
LPLLLQIQSFFFFGAGAIQTYKTRNVVIYRVTGQKELIEVIIPHFQKYPLLTQKRADFELFKSVIELMESRSHKTREGLQKIVNIRASLNKGLSETLKTAFPDVTPVAKLVVEAPKRIDPNWLSGFTEGEGCFLVDIFKSSTMKSGFQVKLLFKITQHSRDEQLMRSLEEYLNCGNYQPSANRDAGDFVVTKFSDIDEKIIPFFKKYQILGVKASDFADFCKVAQLMKNKDHLNQEGLEEIRKIKAGMNRGRMENL